MAYSMACVITHRVAAAWHGMAWYGFGMALRCMTARHDANSCCHAMPCSLLAGCLLHGCSLERP